MKSIFYVFIAIIFSVNALVAQNNQELPKNAVRVDASASKGFSYPYYLFVPDNLSDEKSKLATHNLLVIPNNTGKGDDDLTAGQVAGAVR